MPYYNPNLPEFLDFLYLPDHEKIPGYLSILCRYEEEVGWVRESGFTFRYLEGKLFFHAAPPIPVDVPLGEAASLEEAIEMAKEFLKKWLSLDLKTYGRFQLQVADEIYRLREEKKKQEAERKRLGHSKSL